MLKPLNKSIKSKAISLIHFQSSFYFFLKILDFITCNDQVNKHAVEKENIKMVDERERDKNQICKWWKKGRK
jgi:hypothetical protein